MKIGSRTKTGLLAFLFALPFLSGFVPRLIKHSHIFWNDFDTVACAGQNALAGANFYAADFAMLCPGLHPVAFTYMPIVAHVSGALTASLGGQLYGWLYRALYILSALLLVQTMLLCRRAPGGLAERIPFLGVLTGSALAWGNVAVVLHALIALTARFALRAPILLVAAAAIAGTVKPVFLLYLLAVLYAPWPLWRRALWFALGLAAGLAPLAWFLASGGPYLAPWRAAMEHYVFAVTPGDGFFGWVELFGASAKSAPVYGAYGALLALVAAAGLAMAESARLDATARIWLGIGLGALLFPRLMSEDIFLFAPGMMVVLKVAERSALAAWARALIYGGCAAALALNVFDAADYANKIAWAAFTLAALIVGAASARAWAKNFTFARAPAHA